MRALAFAVVMLGAIGCEPPPLDTDPLSHLPKFEAQREVMCARDRRNAIADVFCADEDEAPNITSLVELQEAIGIGFVEGRPAPGFSFTAHSTSLSTRTVSGTPRSSAPRTRPAS